MGRSLVSERKMSLRECNDQIKYYEDMMGATDDWDKTIIFREKLKELRKKRDEILDPSLRTLKAVSR